MKIVLDEAEMNKAIALYIGAEYSIDSVRIIPGRSRGSTIEVEASKIIEVTTPTIDYPVDVRTVETNTEEPTIKREAETDVTARKPIFPV